MKIRRLFARIALSVIVLIMFMPCLTVFAADDWEGYPYTNNKDFDYGASWGALEEDGDVPYIEMTIMIRKPDSIKNLEVDELRCELRNLPALRVESAEVKNIGENRPYQAYFDFDLNRFLSRDANTPEKLIKEYEQGYKDPDDTSVHEYSEIKVNGYAAVHEKLVTEDGTFSGRIIVFADNMLLPDFFEDDKPYEKQYLCFEISYRGNSQPVLGKGDMEVADVDAYLTDFLKTQYNNFISELTSNLEIVWTRDVDILVDDYKYDKSASVIDTEAEKTPGESGYTVPAMIVTGLAAAGAAIAAGGAAASGAAAGTGAGASGADAGDSGEASEEDNPQSTYKMYISKDFGNKIRYNRHGVQVNARMAEIKPEGTEVDRPDLTQNISITSGGNVDVESGGFSGGYMCALVSCTGVSGADNPKEGVVTFTFSGEGGTFTNNVTFELVGEPRIDVIDELNMIYGDGNRYDVSIELVDFIAPAENITFNYGTTPIEAEAEKVDDTHYTLHIRNNSQKPEVLFATTENLRFEVTAANGKESATEGVVGMLIPEGLSVKRRNDTVIEDERFALKCYANTDDNGEKDIPITRISFMIAIPETAENGATKVKCPTVTENMFTFSPMTADDQRFANIANNAECVFTMEKNASASDSIVTFEIQPKRQIPQESDKKYDITLPVSCECDGSTYTLDVPVRVIGDKLQAEMQAKAKEIALLKVRIRRYLDPDEVAGFLAKYDTKVQDMSAYDIRLMSMSLVFMSQTEAYESRWQGLKANMLDWALWGTEWVKWAGDQAFSMLVNYYAGPQYSPILDSVLSPAKDIICEELGTCLDQWYSGKDITGIKNKFEKYSQTVLVMIENCLTNSIDGKTDVKKAGSLLATYCALRFLNHVMFDDKGMYDAVLATFGDMTAQAFKFTAGMSLEKYIGNPSNKDKIGAVVYKWIKSRMPEGVDGLNSDDVIRKYLEETVAMLGGKVSSEAADVYNAATAGVIIIPIKLNVGNSDGETDVFRDYTVAIDPVASLEKLKDFLFEQMFNAFTFATSPMKMPNDAKFFPKA